MLRQRAELAKTSTKVEAAAAAARAAITAQSDMVTAKDRSIMRREAIEAERTTRIPEVETDQARLEAMPEP